VAGYFGEDQIEEVRRANDIIDVIKEYVPLKRAGKDFKALCPFHSEKTPSFQVSPSKQIFKCFGCGKGGNVFSFVMATERLEFPEAVEFLARRAGIQLERRVEFQERNRRRDTLFEINLWAAKVFHRCLLNSDEGRPGREYFASRGLDESTWKKFRLGYVPGSWDFLLSLGSGKGYVPGDLAAAGLVLPREGGPGHYDRFRNRVMFPIFDVRGRVLGFGGRALDDSTPKYLNSPETSVFSKGMCLYGLDVAKDGVLREKRVAVVEGYTDCLMTHQHGIDWVVATLGTALTGQHVGTLRRYADEVRLVFDGDDAGRAAAERSVELFLTEDVDVRVVLLPGGKDPCDFLVENGVEAFRELLNAASDVFDLKMEMIAGRHDLSRVRGREEATEEVLETLAKTNPLRQDMLLGTNMVRRLCREMRVTEESLRARLRTLVRRRRGGTVVQPKAPRESRSIAAQREVLGTMLSDESLTERFKETLSADDFADEQLRQVAQSLLTAIAAGEGLDVNRVCDRLEDDRLTQVVVDLYHESSEKGHETERFDAALKVLHDDGRRREMQELRRELAEARASGDEEKEVELLRRHQGLMR
jgi:DNA primase